MTPEEMNEKVVKLQNDVLEKATESARLMSDMVQAYDRQNRRLWVAVMALAAALVVTAGCMIWAVQNAQRVANEAVMNALETVAEMEATSETTTTTVNQDTGEGQGNNVYQAGEYATYDEGGAE